MPKVSVIIPTHNRSDLLLSALESVYAQTFHDFEVIVTDDGDSPRSETVLSEYLKKENFTYLETQKNEGAPVARNLGVETAKGEFIAFLDDDDTWEHNKLEKQLNAYNKHPLKDQIGFVFSSITKIDSDSVEVTDIDDMTTDFSVISLRRFSGFMTSTLLMKKHVFDEVGGFDTTFPSHQEPDLIIRVSQKYKGLGINTPLVSMRISMIDDHIGGNLSRRISGREKLLEKHATLLHSHPSTLALSYQWLAYRYRDINDYSEAQKYMNRSLITKFSYLRLFNVLKFTIMNIKYWVIKHVLGPSHYGNLQRGFYINKYWPDLKMPSPQILDAGCGHGLHTVKLLKRYPEANIEAVDIKSSLGWAVFDNNKNIEFRVVDLKEYDRKNCNDLVVSVDVMEHIPDNKVVLEKVCQSLKKGGYLYLAVPCDETAPSIFPERWFVSFREWEKEEHIGEQWLLHQWKEMIENNGLEVLVSRYTFTIWGRFAWEIQFLLRGSNWGDRINVILMPIYKILALFDIYFPLGKGNNLIVAIKN